MISLFFQVQQLPPNDYLTHRLHERLMNLLNQLFVEKVNAKASDTELSDEELTEEEPTDEEPENAELENA